VQCKAADIVSPGHKHNHGLDRFALLGRYHWCVEHCTVSASLLDGIKGNQNLMNPSCLQASGPEQQS
jgi:hypothetical protein